MLATPTSPATVITGETLGRVLISCVQALVIILGSALLFGVNWGQPASMCGGRPAESQARQRNGQPHRRRRAAAGKGRTDEG